MTTGQALTQANGEAPPRPAHRGPAPADPEAVQVHPARVEVQQITTGPGHDSGSLPAGLGLDEEAPQPGEVAVQPRPHPGGRIVVPDPVDERFHRDRPAGVDRQRDQDGALPRRAQLHRPARHAQLHRAEHPRLHHGSPSAAARPPRWQNHTVPQRG
jgi:hypothetical protein